MSTENTTATQRQSRTGKVPVVLPAGVQTTITGQKVAIKGPKGTLERVLPELVRIEQKENQLLLSPVQGSGKNGACAQGLSRALLSNMAQGVAKGYEKSMDLYGVGYKADVSGGNLSLSLGLSHGVKMPIPTGVKIVVETIDEGGQKRPRLKLSSHDKELLGQVAAQIRTYRPPEPYKGKGVRFTDERVRQKAGKAGAKSGAKK